VDLQQKAQALSRVALFASLFERELLQLARQVSHAHVAAGEEVYPHGSDPTDLLIVVAGRVELSVRLPDGGKQFVGVREPATVFGEMAALDGNPRMADAHAGADTDLLLMPRQVFIDVAQEHLAVAEAVYDVMSTVYRQRLRQGDREAVAELLRAMALTTRRAAATVAVEPMEPLPAPAPVPAPVAEGLPGDGDTNF
jgi:CRP-like cAMP-binding protein